MKKKTIFQEFSETNMLLFKSLTNRYKNLNLNVTPVQSRIIMYLYENQDEIYQKDLEKYIGCNKSTLSSVLSTMEKNGFIERQSTKDDSRKNHICLTSTSLDIVHILDKDHKEIDETLEDGISEEEIEAFRAFLKKINKNIERI